MHHHQPFLPFPQSDKVAKKPKPSVSTPAVPIVSDEDQNDPGTDARDKKASVKSDKKSFNFIGDVLYNVRTVLASNDFT